VPQKIYRLIKARVKRCGKSTPVFWRQKTHGKPHREQDQIEMAWLEEFEPKAVLSLPSGLVARV